VRFVGSSFGFILLLISSAAIGQMPRLGSIEMLNCSGLPCVEVTVSHQRHLRLLIDTGNLDSVLDATLARQLELSLSPLTGEDGKPVPGYNRARLPKVMLGKTTLKDINLLVMDLDPYKKQGRFPNADGTLAYPIFKDRLLKLDYRNKAVSLSEPLSREVPCESFCGEITLPTFGKQGPPIVVTNGFSINGLSMTAQLDTLFAGTMLIYPPSVEKLGLAHEAASSRKEFFPYTDNGVEMTVGQAKNESFGDLTLMNDPSVYFATPAVHTPDGMFDATVGQGLLRNRALWLDFHDMHAWIR
jgi:Aspartyl protease